MIHADPGVPTLIGREVTVGHMAMLHSCVIGDHSLIGNGAIVLDRARIGRHCIIGAGALVPPDSQIPDGAVVMGMPAKIRRETGPEDRAMIAHAAADYRQRMGRYRRHLRALAVP